MVTIKFQSLQNLDFAGFFYAQNLLKCVKRKTQDNYLINKYTFAQYNMNPIKPSQIIVR
jgi:hypothetical protein